jgi:hypothetical protein
MHNNIRAQLQWLLEIGACKCIIDNNQQIVTMCDFCDSPNIYQP